MCTLVKSLIIFPLKKNPSSTLFKKKEILNASRKFLFIIHCIFNDVFLSWKFQQHATGYENPASFKFLPVFSLQFYILKTRYPHQRWSSIKTFGILHNSFFMASKDKLCLNSCLHEPPSVVSILFWRITLHKDAFCQKRIGYINSECIKELELIDTFAKRTARLDTTHYKIMLIIFTHFSRLCLYRYYYISNFEYNMKWNAWYFEILYIIN